jgi:hypothetical protein
MGSNPIRPAPFTGSCPEPVLPVLNSLQDKVNSKTCKELWKKDVNQKQREEGIPRDLRQREISSKQRDCSSSARAEEIWIFCVPRSSQFELEHSGKPLRHYGNLHSCRGRSPATRHLQPDDLAHNRRLEHHPWRQKRCVAVPH